MHLMHIFNWLSPNDRPCCRELHVVARSPVWGSTELASETGASHFLPSADIRSSYRAHHSPLKAESQRIVKPLAHMRLLCHTSPKRGICVFLRLVSLNPRYEREATPMVRNGCIYPRPDDRSACRAGAHTGPSVSQAKKQLQSSAAAPKPKAK